MEWYRDKRTTNGVRRVVIRLDVGVLHGLVQAGDNGLNLERRVVCKCVGEDITGGNVDTLLEEVVLENDEAMVDRSRITDDALPVVEHLGRGRETTSNVEV